MIAKLAGRQQYKPLADLAKEMAKETSPLPKVEPSSIIKNFKNKKALAIGAGVAALGGGALAYLKSKKK
jgi:hypothetical protein